MFTFAGFVFGVVGQELWRGVRARRAVAHEAVPVALVSLVKRNRRRYGGYLVHLGVVTLFVGVAASSTFQKIHEVRLSPGQSTQVGDYRFTYVKPTAQLHAAPNGRLERISLGARLQRPQGLARADRSTRPRTTSRRRTRRSARCRASSTASRPPRSACDAALRNDVWSAVAPDTSRLRRASPRATACSPRAASSLTPEQENEFLAAALGGLTASYAKNPPPATFRLRGLAAGHLDLDRRR